MSNGNGEDRSLMVIRDVNLVTLFTEGGIESLLDAIEKEARSHIMPVETPQGRAAMKTLAYKVAQAKVKIDDTGKELVSEWKNKAKVVDETRRKVRERLDALKEEVRAPLTEWEEAEKARVAAEKIAAEIEACWDAAHVENELFDLRRKEAERERAEQERLEKERIQKEKEEHDRLVAEEAARIAAQEERDKAQREIDEARRREAEAKLREEQAEKARLQAIEDAKAEKERAVQEERERIEREQAEKERIKAEQAEKDRIAAEKAAANKAHRKNVNTEALKGFTGNGIEMETAKAVVKLIIEGRIPHVTITY